MFLKGFTQEERNKLAMICGLFLAQGDIKADCLKGLLSDHLVKDGKCRIWPNIMFKKFIQMSLFVVSLPIMVLHFSKLCIYMLRATIRTMVSALSSAKMFKKKEKKRKTTFSNIMVNQRFQV